MEYDPWGYHDSLEQPGRPRRELFAATFSVQDGASWVVPRQLTPLQSSALTQSLRPSNAGVESKVRLLEDDGTTDWPVSSQQEGGDPVCGALDSAIMSLAVSWNKPVPLSQAGSASHPNGAVAAGGPTACRAIRRMSRTELPPDHSAASYTRFRSMDLPESLKHQVPLSSSMNKLSKSQLEFGSQVSSARSSEAGRPSVSKDNILPDISGNKTSKPSSRRRSQNAWNHLSVMTEVLVGMPTPSTRGRQWSQLAYNGSEDLGRSPPVSTQSSIEDRTHGSGMYRSMARDGLSPPASSYTKLMKPSPPAVQPALSTPSSPRTMRRFGYTGVAYISNTATSPSRACDSNASPISSTIGMGGLQLSVAYDSFIASLNLNDDD